MLPADDQAFRAVRYGHCVAVAGDVDEFVVAEFRAAVDHPDVSAVDLAAVTFMGSAGLGVLLAARTHRLATGSELVVCNPSRPVRRLFEVTGVLDAFGVPLAPSAGP